MVEWLDGGIEVVSETRLRSLEDEVDRGFEAGLAEGTVAAVVGGDVVEVPEDVLESGKVVSCRTIGGLIG